MPQIRSNAYNPLNDAIRSAVGTHNSEGSCSTFIQEKMEAYEKALHTIRDRLIDDPAQLAHNALYLESFR